MESRLAAYGFTTAYRGDPKDDSELSAENFQRRNPAKMWNLSEKQIKNYEDEGYTIYDPTDMNSLGERDISMGSGWMVTVDRKYIGNSMGSYKVKTGNTIYIQFTCDLGKDIDVSAY